MRIAIVGGRGLIGRALSKELVDTGHQPVVLSRHAQTGERQGGAEVVQWDGKNAAALSLVINGCDALVNLAGESIGTRRWTQKRLKEIYDSRLIPGKAITDAWQLMQQPPKVLVQASAVGYYGNTETPTTENELPGRDSMAELCIKWEASTRGVTGKDTRHVVIRSGVVLDSSHGILPQMMLPFKLFIGGPVGRGGQWISWIHIQDEVRAIRFLLENANLSGAFNLTAPKPVTNAEFGKALSKVMHRPYWIPAPAFALRLALGDMSSLVLEGQEVIPKRLVESDFGYNFPDLQSALINLL